MEDKPADRNALDHVAKAGIPAAKPTGPIQTIAAISKQPLAWLGGGASESRKTFTEEEREYFSDPLFTDVFDARPGPDDIQQIDIFDRVALVEFFPSFQNGAFAELALENCALTYYPREIGLNKPGLYFQTDVVLGGLLDNCSEFFKMFLSESYIVIRLSAFLGFTLERNKPFHFDEFVLSGCLGGLKLCYPPGAVLLEVVSAGVRITFANEKKDEKSGKRGLEQDTTGPAPKRQKQSGDKDTSGSNEESEQKASSQLTSTSSQPRPSESETPDLLKLTDPQKLVGLGSTVLTNPSGPVTTDTQSKPDVTYKSGKSSFSVEIFGNILFHIPFGSIVPLQLEYTAQYTPENVHFDMVLSQDKTWKNVFGVENFEVYSGILPPNPLAHMNSKLQDIVITADVPTNSANKAFGKMAEEAALDEGFACRVKGTWGFGSKSLSLKGEIFSATQPEKTSFIEATIGELKWNDICEVAKKLYEYDVETPKQKLEFGTFRVRLSKAQFTLYGPMKIDDASFEVAIVIGSHGLFISGTAKEFHVPNSEVVIKEALLDFTISRRTKGAPDPHAEKSSSDEQEGFDTPKKGGAADEIEVRASGPVAEGKDGPPKGRIENGGAEKCSQNPGASAMDEARRNEALSAVKAKDAAATTDETATPATVTTAAQKEVSWYIGFKVLGIVILPFGAKESDRPDADYKFKFAVTFSAAYSPKGGWEVLVAGKARSTVSLRDIISSIPKDSLLDSQLSDLTFIGTNADNPYIPKEISQFPVKKGFFLCATLERVPLVETEDGGGKMLRKSTASDRAYLRIGHQKGEKIPKITIFLPPSFRIDFGERFYTGAIFLELDANSQPICKFHGELYMRMQEEHKRPVKFVLEIGADAVRGSLALGMEASDGLKGPLGLSDRIVIYDLKGSIDVVWTALLSTGSISGFGLGGTFAVDQDLYICEMCMAPNPSQNLVNIKADNLGMRQIVNVITAVIQEDMEIPDMDLDVVQLRKVEIYASSGCTWLDAYYPKGFKFKALIKLWDFEASMDAEVSTIGFHLLTKVKGFQIGPLKVRGSREQDEDAELEVTLNPLQQSIFVTGRIEIFGLTCVCFIDCQFMPEPKFDFNFELTWNASLKVQIRAKRHVQQLQLGREKGSGKELHKNPAGADWELYALFQQSLIAEVKQGIMAAIENTHKALGKGIGAAQDAIAREQEAYDRRCREAEAALEAKYKLQQAEIDELNTKIQAAKDNLESVKQGNLLRMDSENQKRSSTRAQAEKDRAGRLEPVNTKRRSADEEKARQEREKPQKFQEAQRRRDEKRTAFFSKFGNAEADINSAIQDADRAQAEVNRLEDDLQSLEWRIKKDWWPRPDLRIEQGTILTAKMVALAGLETYRFILRGAQAIIQTDLFREFRQAMEAAENYLNTIGDQIASALETAGRIAAKAFEELQQAIKDEDFSFDSIMRRANNIVDYAQQECENFEKEAVARKDVLDAERRKVELEFQQVGSVALRNAVEFARKNNIALIAAQKALEAISALEKAAYSAIKDFVGKALDSMIDIQKVELKGMIMADTSKQEAFELIVKGRLGGKDFELTERWMPGKTAIFLAKVGLHAVAQITDSNMDKEIQALDDEMMKPG